MSQPTNGELLKEIKQIHSVLEDHEARIRQWEIFKVGYDAAIAAVEKYKQDNAAPAPPPVPTGLDGRLSDGINKDFVKVVLQFMGLVSTGLGIIYLLVQYVTR